LIYTDFNKIIIHNLLIFVNIYNKQQILTGNPSKGG